MLQLADCAVEIQRQDLEDLEATADDYLKVADIKDNFPEDGFDASPKARFAAEIAKKYITDKTRTGHLR